jgi:hypothetical protein
MGDLGPVPWYAIDWKDEFENISGIDRIIRSISHLIKLGNESEFSLTIRQKKQILTIKYEDVVEKTGMVIDKISLFLNSSPLNNIDEILKKENCPRSLKINNRNKKEKFILSKASQKYISLVIEMSKNYNTN